MLALTTVLAACDGLGEFRTEPGEVFEGSVIGAEGGDSAFIRNERAQNAKLVKFAGIKIE